VLFLKRNGYKSREDIMGRYLLCNVELLLKLFITAPPLFVDFATMVKGSDIGTLSGDE
jgi:hypothetical protein